MDEYDDYETYDDYNGSYALFHFCFDIHTSLLNLFHRNNIV